MKEIKNLNRKRINKQYNFISKYNKINNNDEYNKLIKNVIINLLI